VILLMMMEDGAKEIYSEKGIMSKRIKDEKVL
jgi:hypothetical protein